MSAISSPTHMNGIMLFGQIKLKPLITGLVSFIPGSVSVGWFFKKLLGKAEDSRALDFGFNILQQRLQDVQEFDFDIQEKTFLEIAPGDNLSGPIAAVLMGAQTGIAIDAYDYTNFDVNDSVVKELGEKIAIDNQQLEKVKSDIKNFDKTKPSQYFQYFAPWKEDDIEAGSVDIATSISVLEHVKDPDELYKALYRWIKSGGFLVNKIDFSSHGLTKDWYGHYILPSWLWALIEGKKTSHINRWTEDQHIASCEKAGFSLLKRRVFEGDEQPGGGLGDHPKAAVHVWQKEHS